MTGKAEKKTYTPAMLDADERAYVEARAARERVSLGQIVRWCVQFAMRHDTTNGDTTGRDDRKAA